MNKYKHGLVVGKFYPPHRGHEYLIDTALSQCEKVTVMVVRGTNEYPDAKTRRNWLAEHYQSDAWKTNHIRISVATPPDHLQEHDSPGWAAFAWNFVYGPIDAVFTSEDYGEPWSHYLNVEHVSVDRSRLLFPISGTEVRRNPWKHWDNILPEARPFFALRVVIVGADSTGKTTLAQKLAEHYQTVWVPELGRTYAEAMVPAREAVWDWDIKDFWSIAELQSKFETNIARKANKLYICDTDVDCTVLWLKRYLPKEDYSGLREFAEKLRRPHNSFHIHCAPDFKFVQDGTRDEGDQEMEDRRQMDISFQWQLGTMAQRPNSGAAKRVLTSLSLGGNIDFRVSESVKEIDRRIEAGWL